MERFKDTLSSAWDFVLTLLAGAVFFGFWAWAIATGINLALGGDR